jgi:hypothetical protein
MARTAEVKRDARIGEAEAKRDAQIKEAMAEEERMASRYTASFYAYINISFIETQEWSWNRCLFNSSQLWTDTYITGGFLTHLAIPQFS